MTLTTSMPREPLFATFPNGQCSADEVVPLMVRGLEVTLREDIAPEVSAPGGTLLAEQPVSDVRSVEYSASDLQSGVAKVEAVIDDSPVAARDLEAACTYADLNACPTADRDTLLVDTRKLVDGHHLLELRVTDAAGNRHDELIRTIEVRNDIDQAPAPPPVPSAAPAVKLTATFVSSRPTPTVPFSGRVSIRGRLTTTTGAALAGERIEMFERPAKVGAAEASVGSAQTREDGTFGYTLAGRRPSRTVRVVYGQTSARLLRIRVRAASTLHVSLHGTLMRFTGRVLSRPLPAGGKRVVLQGRAPGYKWTSFASTKTDRNGRFVGSFRLTARRPGVRLQIRVRVPTEHGYPYAGYASRPSMLTVL
jgi:hypothetical protein